MFLIRGGVRGSREEVVAHALTRGMGWRSCEPLEPADVSAGEKPRANAGSHLSG